MSGKKGRRKEKCRKGVMQNTLQSVGKVLKVIEVVIKERRKAKE